MTCPKCGSTGDLKEEVWSAWGLHTLGLVAPGLKIWGVCSACGFTAKPGYFGPNRLDYSPEEREALEAGTRARAIASFEAGIAYKMPTASGQ